jgi:hypothetical protein
MASDLRIAVNKALGDLRRQISKKRSELTILRSELAKYEKVRGILTSQPKAGETKANGNARRKPVDWNSVLNRLPGSFAVGNVTHLAKIKSKNHAHHVLANWVKQRKIKRVERGRYQKL